MKNFTPDERAADANIENTRGRAKPDTGILWGICRRTYKCGVIGGKRGGNGGKCEAGRGAAGETEEETRLYKERKIWTEGHTQGIGKTLSTIENPTIYIYVHNGAAKLPRQGLRRKKKTGSTLQVLPAPNHFVHFEYGKTRKCEL